MGRCTVEFVPLNPHGILPDSQWLSDRYTDPTGWADWYSDAQNNKGSLYGEDGRKDPGGFSDSLRTLCASGAMDQERESSRVLRGVLKKEWTMTSSKNTTSSADLRGCVCLFQINRPYNYALECNLWGIKDRNSGSAPTPEPPRFLCLIIIYILWLLSHTFTSFTYFPSLSFTLSQLCLLLWGLHCLTIPLFSSVFLMVFVVFICRSSSPLSVHNTSLSILPSFIKSSLSLSLPLSVFVPDAWWARGW